MENGSAEGKGEKGRKIEFIWVNACQGTALVKSHVTR